MRIKGQDLVDIIKQVGGYITSDYQDVAFAVQKRIQDDGNTVQFADILVALDQLNGVNDEGARNLKLITALAEKARKLEQIRREEEESWKKLLGTDPLRALHSDPLRFAGSCFLLSRISPEGIDSVCKRIENSSQKLGWFQVATGSEAEIYVAGKHLPDEGTCELAFGLNKLPTGAIGGAAAYYLPWSERTVYRVTLDLGTGPYAPKFAFTANLTGCQVALRGAPDLPTFYHANSGATKDSNEKESVSLVLGAKLMYEDIEAFELLRISGRKYNSGLDKVLKPLDYTDLGVQGLTQTTTEMILRQCMGSVFGVQKDGEWQFYYQSAYVEKRQSFETGIKTLKYTILHSGKLWP